MNNSYYPKFAFGNIRKNGKTYIPYLITSILTIAMFYIIHSLYLNKDLGEISGTMVYTLELGCYMVGLFSIIFLFYTNSFLMKQRKKEFGLYSILGMEKKHIAKMIAYETFFIALISLILGFALGIVLDKAMYLALLKMLEADVPLGFYISKSTIITTIILFFAIYFLIYINSIRQIYFSNPIELLHSANTGEKEPKSKWFMAILGLAFLGTGYYISLSIYNPYEAIKDFFVAVILVIIGTYLVFTSGSILFLKILRKNKSYYYKTKHFISVAGMIYRMKQNAVGLANICILVTMVLVMISSTSSLWFGMNDMLESKSPNDLAAKISLPLNSNISDSNNIYDEVENEIKSNGYIIENSQTFNMLSFTLFQDKNKFWAEEASDAESTQAQLDKIKIVDVFTLEDYNRINNSNETLNNNEILFYSQKNTNEYSYSDFNLFDTYYNVKKQLNSFPMTALSTMSIFDTYKIVVEDMNVLESIYNFQKEIYKDNASKLSIYVGFDIDANKDEQLVLSENLRKSIKDNSDPNYYYNIKSNADTRQDALGIYGGFLFLGLFLGALFTIATILIIYYKQISEGYDDKQRFDIMQKVGMSHQEVKQTIHSQVLTVFFLPLITAGIHIIFAFPVISLLLKVLQLLNTKLFIICTVICFIVFSVIYSIIYLLTAKTYYKIVSR